MLLDSLVRGGFACLWFCALIFLFVALNHKFNNLHLYVVALLFTGISCVYKPKSFGLEVVLTLESLISYGFAAYSFVSQWHSFTSPVAQ